MSSYLYANNAVTTLAASVGVGDTSIVLASGTGSRFPAFTPTDTGFVTLYDFATGEQIEIVLCTNRTGDTLTIQRAQDHTTAKTFITGDKVALQLVAGQIGDFASLLHGGTFTGPVAVPTMPPSDNSTSAASTAFVKATIGTSAVSSVEGRSGDVVLVAGDIDNALNYTPANQAGDTFTGTVTAPTFVSSGASIGRFIVTDLSQGADAKTWDFSYFGGSFRLRAINDAQTSATDVFTLNRVGAAAGTWAFNVPVTITTNSTAALTLFGNSASPVGVSIGNSSPGGRTFLLGATTGTGVFVLQDSTSGSTRFAVGPNKSVLPQNILELSDNTSTPFNTSIRSPSAATYKQTGAFSYYWRRTDDGTPAGTSPVEMMSLSDAGDLTVLHSVVTPALNLTSSRALKTEFADNKGALARVLSWKPKTYRLKAAPLRKRTGFVVEESPANIVDGKAIDIYAVVADLASAVQELTKEVRAIRH